MYLLQNQDGNEGGGSNIDFIWALNDNSPLKFTVAFLIPPKTFLVHPINEYLKEK